MEHLFRFKPLAERYDGFILDLWGVIHDGVSPYAKASQTLARLRDEGKKVVLLSNAPRRAVFAQADLHDMGLPDDLYTGIVTSGEQTWRWLAERSDPWFAKLGRRVYFLGPERDHNIVEGISLTQVETPAEADFVVNAGPNDLCGPTKVSDHEEVLQACRRANLPMICANPDLEIVRDGVSIICAGALAKRYETLGGEVKWVGKPDPAIYAPALTMLNMPKERVVAVGDALRTDIAGAAAAGLVSCWILDGIHGSQLDRDPASIEKTAWDAGLDPEFSLPNFTW